MSRVKNFYADNMPESYLDQMDREADENMAALYDNYTVPVREVKPLPQVTRDEITLEMTKAWGEQ